MAQHPHRTSHMEETVETFYKRAETSNLQLLAVLKEGLTALPSWAQAHMLNNLNRPMQLGRVPAQEECNQQLYWGLVYPNSFVTPQELNPAVFADHFYQVIGSGVIREDLIFGRWSEHRAVMYGWLLIASVIYAANPDARHAHAQLIEAVMGGDLIRTMEKYADILLLIPASPRRVDATEAAVCEKLLNELARFGVKPYVKHQVIENPSLFRNKDWIDWAMRTEPVVA